MKIELITKQEYVEIADICDAFPALTLENKGYEYINKNDLTEEGKTAIKTVEAILSKAICGFSKFSNFRLNDSDKIQIRFQYDYSAEEKKTIPFIGVGYIQLGELLNGFSQNTK